MFISPDSRPRRSPALVLLGALAVFTLALTAPAPARDVVPTPAGGGAGVNVYPPDQANPTGLPAPGHQQLPRDFADQPARGGARYDDVGGDDSEIVTVNHAYDGDLAVASNGDLFAIVMHALEDPGDYEYIVSRSDDGGTTWREWAEFAHPTPGYRYWDPEIHVAEGDQDRVFVVYTLDPGDDPYEVHVAWSPLDLEDGDFSNDTTIFTAPTDGIYAPSFTTDAATWDSYFCYLTFSADDGNGNDIYFVRSTDQGTTWESEYVIGTIGVSDRGYYSPRVAVGYGGWVHVAWFLGFDTDHEYDNTIRYRRVPSYAGGGLASWENIQSITPHTDDIDMIDTHIAASWVSPDLMMAFIRRLRNPDGSTSYSGNITLTSGDSGASWSGMTVFGTGLEWLGDVVHQEVNDRWLIGVNDIVWGFRWAPVASPTDWSGCIEFADQYYSAGEPSIILDPTHDDRIGIRGGGRNQDDTYTFYFDGEWRADPGYPNLEPGFPVDLASAPASDPAVVDLNGDGYLDIVFTDAADRIQVYQIDGLPLAGWPVQVSTALVETPVAVGDLDGDGELSVVVGTENGLVLVYAADGTLEDGWPVNVAGVGPAHVAIGSVGGPYPRAIVVGSGNTVSLLDWHGGTFPGTTTSSISGRIISTPPAIGDVNGEGQNYIVVAGEEVVMVFRPKPPYDADFLQLEADVSGGITLADFDQDGDVEIVAPLANGVVHLLQGDLEEYPGAWPVTAADSEINGAAIAHFLGNSEPEIAISAHDYLVTVIRDDGDIGAGWPEDTDGWYVFGKPVIGRVEAAASDVIVGARGRKGWAWSGGSSLIDGWPKILDDHIYLTPAYGDLDLDGMAEIVFLTSTQLAVVDIGVTPTTAAATWAMAGHDPERSGCSDCAVDVVGVEDAPAGVTRVSMAAPWPNPIAGQATFAYAVPVRARVELAIYDVRGRRVATVHRAEETAGRHVIGWNGRDGDGRPVASGQYVAALRVTGPGVDETVSRKVTVLR